MASLLARCAPAADEAALVARLAQYDFSAAAHTHLVASAPGLHALHPPPMVATLSFFATPGARAFG